MVRARDKGSVSKGIRHNFCAYYIILGIWNSHEDHVHAKYRQYSITTEPRRNGGTGRHADLNGANATAEAV
jgi:hypothetical protein